MVELLYKARMARCIRSQKHQIISTHRLHVAIDWHGQIVDLEVHDYGHPEKR